jgi:hypothetical protein
MPNNAFKLFNVKIDLKVSSSLINYKKLIVKIYFCVENLYLITFVI